MNTATIPINDDCQACDSPPLDTGQQRAAPPNEDTPEQKYRFRHHETYRSKLRELLPSLTIPDSHARRFEECGSNAWVVFSQSRHKYSLRVNSCKHRWCPKCHARTTARITHRLRSALIGTKVKRWKLLTLTTVATKLPLIQRIKHLRASFRRMRSKSWWKSWVRGGYAVVETTFNPKTKQWHPHLHCIIDAEYMRAGTISQEWLKATKDSFIIDIRAIKHTTAAIGYVAGYVGKLPDESLLDNADATSEFITAIHGTRLLSSFGTVPKISTEPDEPEGVNDWQPIQRLHEILAFASRGVTWAVAILSKLEISAHEIDHPEPEHPP